MARLLQALSLLSCAALALSLNIPRPLLAARDGLVPHVSPTAVDIFPAGDGAYPRLAALASGALLGTVTQVSGGNKILQVTRSTDGGRSFAALGSIATAPGDLDNANLLELSPGGAVLAAFRNHDLNAAGAPTYYRITACVSHDGGATWSFLSQVAERAAGADNNGLWEPFLRLSKKDGSLQVYYASENSGADQDILMQTSFDGGKTWGAPVTVAGATTTGRDGMPGCANFNDGADKLMCVFETTEGRGGLFSVKSVVSTDEGATWGQRSVVYNPGGSLNAGAPQIAATEDDKLVVSFMTDEDNTAAHSWPDGASFKVVTGAPVATGAWGERTVVTGIPSFWPGLLTLGSEVIGCGGHANEGAVCHAITFTQS
ncbi:glycoside hydrolase family 93 protein [Epithele typhae]|uniref:glycoside hydrolase family 93 protein n=1 Tax=Epithele typhae TaxID=378194 RepID=UPI002008E753|nr:glycoside hydrolase family 93 protein [Epithele typhae]KAH9945947.1 glycoside hydrolase family 93 protein [Epithele typhae]